MPERYNFVAYAYRCDLRLDQESLIEKTRQSFANSLRQFERVTLINVCTNALANLSSPHVGAALRKELTPNEILFVYYRGKGNDVHTSPSISIHRNGGYVVTVSLEKSDVDAWGRDFVVKTLINFLSAVSDFLISPIICAGPELSVDLTAEEHLSVENWLNSVSLAEWIATKEPIQKVAPPFSIQDVEGVTVVSRNH